MVHVEGIYFEDWARNSNQVSGGKRNAGKRRSFYNWGRPVEGLSAVCFAVRGGVGGKKEGGCVGEVTGSAWRGI